MSMKNSLRGPGSTGSEIKCGIILVINLNLGSSIQRLPHNFPVALRPRGTIFTHKYQVLDRHLISDFTYPLRKLRTVNQHPGLGRINTIPDFFRRIAEVQGHGQSPGP